MNNDSQLRNSPVPISTFDKKSRNGGFLDGINRNAKSIGLLFTVLFTIIGCFLWLDNQFEKVNSKTNDLRLEVSSELGDQTRLIRDNKQNLSVLTERVSNIQEDVEIIRNRVDSGLDRTSYLP